jgi:acetyl esterase/lipase
VGTLDLFHDEDLAYAKRLNDSGVKCALHVVDGAFHAFDAVFRKAPVTQAFRAAQVSALRAALFVDAAEDRTRQSADNPL